MIRKAVLATAMAISSAALALDVQVDGTQKHQAIEGFGTCLISWVPRMAEYYRTPDAARTYAEDLRFNFVRCNLWGDGTIGLTEDAGQISHTDPAFAKNDPRTPVFIQFAKAISKYNPDVKVIGTVWSPPKWMKANNSIVAPRSGAVFGTTYVLGDNGGPTDNYVKKEFYPHFAKWVVEMAKYYEANGVKMYALSPANEPQFNQTFESCAWTAKDLATITGMLGEQLEKEGMGHIKIFGPEGMTGFNWEGGPNRQFVQAIQADPVAWKHFDVFAAHGYEDGFKADVSANSSAQFWNLIKDTGKPFWVTEGGTGTHNWPGVIKDNGVAAALHNSLVAGNASAWVPWQFVEDRPSQHALAVVGRMTKKTYVVRHYSRYIPAGAVRVEASPAYGDVLVSAFSHGANGVTMVVINPTDQPQELSLKLEGLGDITQLNVIRTSANEDCATAGPVKITNGAGTYAMPAQCIVTLTTLEP